MELAKYDGRTDTTAKGSPKYVNAQTGLPVQGIARGHKRCPNRLRGYAVTEGNTGITSQHHGNNIATYPAHNKRDVWIITNHPFKGAHFATYPPALITDCIKAGRPPQGVVLDPFMGSGTTGLVAKKIGKKFYRY